MEEGEWWAVETSSLQWHYEQQMRFRGDVKSDNHHVQNNYYYYSFCDDQGLGGGDGENDEECGRKVSHLSSCNQDETGSGDAAMFLAAVVYGFEKEVGMDPLCGKEKFGAVQRRSVLEWCCSTSSCGDGRCFVLLAFAVVVSSVMRGVDLHMDGNVETCGLLMLSTTLTATTTTTAPHMTVYSLYAGIARIGAEWVLGGFDLSHEEDLGHLFWCMRLRIDTVRVRVVVVVPAHCCAMRRKPLKAGAPHLHCYSSLTARAKRV
jgi:hypothetical protein